MSFYWKTMRKTTRCLLLFLFYFTNENKEIQMCTTIDKIDTLPRNANDSVKLQRLNRGYRLTAQRCAAPYLSRLSLKIGVPSDFRSRYLPSVARAVAMTDVYFILAFPFFFREYLCFPSRSQARAYTKRARVLLSFCASSQGERETYVRGSINVSARYSHREDIFPRETNAKRDCHCCVSKSGPLQI